MEYKGRILRVLPMKEGTSEKTGNTWKSQPFIFEYFEHDTDRYSDKVLLETFNEDFIQHISEGAEVLCGFGHTVNEYNGNLYNRLRLYRLEPLEKKDGQSEEDAPF